MSGACGTGRRMSLSVPGLPPRVAPQRGSTLRRSASRGRVAGAREVVAGCGPRLSWFPMRLCVLDRLEMFERKARRGQPQVGRRTALGTTWLNAHPTVQLSRAKVKQGQRTKNHMNFVQPQGTHA